jgi:hypothetical protein
LNCLVCSEVLHPSLHDVGTHPTCDDQDTKDQGLVDLAEHLKKRLTEVILWANDNSARSLQAAIGPSEIGTPCDRKLAYKLAGNPVINDRRDPWAAIVGTAVHSWLEKAVDKYQGVGIGDSDWEAPPSWDGRWDLLTEKEVQVDPLVPGHVDLYQVSTQTVIDYKTAGPDVFKKIVKEGPPAGYKIQTQLYGLGYANAGRKVEHVALVFLPRAGWLSSMYVWTDRYRPDVAHKALERMYAIKRGIEQVDIWNHPEIYEKIPAVSDHCGFCPFYRRAGLMDGTEATNEGCPGA